MFCNLLREGIPGLFDLSDGDEDGEGFHSGRAPKYPR